LYRPAMGNPRPLKLFSAALQKPLKYWYFIEKSTKSVALYFGPWHDCLAKLWPSNRFGLPMAGIDHSKKNNRGIRSRAKFMQNRFFLVSSFWIICWIFSKLAIFRGSRKTALKNKEGHKWAPSPWLDIPG
jgi:hypothetical protein